MFLFMLTCCCDPATPPLSDKRDGSVASSVTWRSNTSIVIKSEKKVGNNVLCSLAAAYEGGRPPIIKIGKAFPYVTEGVESEQPVGGPFYQWVGCRDHAGLACFPHSGSWFLREDQFYM